MSPEDPNRLLPGLLPRPPPTVKGRNLYPRTPPEVVRVRAPWRERTQVVPVSGLWKGTRGSVLGLCTLKVSL